MFTPDKFQIDAINDVKKGSNVLVVAPTGSGKTYIAEKSIDYYLSKQKNIFYTTPIKALSNQKYNDFNRQGIRTGLLTGDRSIDKDAELVIATTEILRNMIFSKDSKLNDTGLIILDEVHYLADKERGTTWEEILIHANKDIKFLSLSATINNKNEFLEWLVSLRGTTSL
ncbi:MAG: DEAD/DEAH box helicase, partial [Candidatus Actinomarina sp.]